MAKTASRSQSRSRSSGRRPAPTRSAKRADHRPEVIVDFIFDRGLLFISVENIGDRPALNVATTFDRKFFGLDGKQEMPALRLFKNIAFLAPRKSIQTFLDASRAYFQRGEPARLAVTVAYRDQEQRRYRATLHHDLSIYEDIAYVPRP